MGDLQYPIGKFNEKTENLSQEEREHLIGDLADLPFKLRAAIKELSPQQLDTPYRPDGWTVRQVVNHVTDSHLNGYARCKWLLTEDEPTIKPYNQELWAELEDTKNGDPETSVLLLEALHQRWADLMKSLSPEDFTRTLHHPEEGTLTLDNILGGYAWHGRHHVAHITSLRERMGW